MKIAIMSDTHDNVDATIKALDIVKAKGCSIIIHAGDICSPFTARTIKDSGINNHCVFGNNDGDRLHLAQILDIKPAPRHLAVEGKSFAVFHEPFINDYIDASRVDFLVFGHTHKLNIDDRDGMRIINPGTVSGTLAGLKSFIVLDLTAGKAEIVEL